jgi:hypothetical protein
MRTLVGEEAHLSKLEYFMLVKIGIERMACEPIWVHLCLNVFSALKNRDAPEQDPCPTPACKVLVVS